ncbi:MAG: prolyl oligopeptidase family serine peptidase [Bacteroidetes bacterium]|nr:prolyl oligopeptidase family serine peptidase [Bacteroidota bacterium]
MKKALILSIAAIMMIFTGCQEGAKKINYPVTEKVQQIDNYFGVDVEDPYRWLEDDNSEQTLAWVQAQNQVTGEYLSQIPFREKIREKLTKMWDYPKFGLPYREGKYYFFSKNDGLQNQSIVYIQEGLDGEPRVILDPNKLSEDGTVAYAGSSVSHDGKYMAYKIARGGSDWNEIFIKDIETGDILDDHIEWVKFSGISWKGDGFFYSAYDKPVEGEELSNKNEYHKVFYHKVGTPQSEDELIYENKDFPLRNYYVGTTEDERFLLMYEVESTSGNALYFKELDKKGSGFVKIADGFDHDFGIIDNIGDLFLMVTNFEAPKQRVVMVNSHNPAMENWKTIIPEKEEVLSSVTLAGGMMVAEYMKDANSKVEIYTPQGEFVRELELPTLGTLAGFSSKPEDDIAFYGFTSFTYPATIFKYNIKDNTTEVFREPGIEFNGEDYTVEQVFYNSKDGTKVPMFIVYKKGLVMDGNNPALLYGYGGFNISETPDFSVSRLIFLENGGIFVVANIRGGGEYGEEWHKAGTKLQKQNVFDDFIAAAEYLIDKKYTSSEKLAIMGGSNGGLLVGACMTQRPDLFKVALPIVGVLDMLRYHTFTIGWAWASDYGTSEEDSTMFRYLLGYSPLHNIKEGVSYPATLAFTADHDDRVVPAHSFKFMATLQEKNDGHNPVLIRIETKAGHGAGKPTSKRIEEATDMWSFVFFNLGMKL